MPFAVEKLWHHAQCHRLRLHFFPPNAGKPVLLQPCKLFLWKRRMQNEVTVNIKRFIHGERKRVQVDESPSQDLRRR